MTHSTLAPFWRYYGSKWRAAPSYPRPQHTTIVEPFAGAAGYSTRYHWLDVILIEKYPVVAELWRYLIGASEREIRAIPEVEHTDEIPSWVPLGGRYLVGFSLRDAVTQPSKSLSAGRRKLTTMGRNFEGWCHNRRERIADQLQFIRHWKIIEGDYTSFDGYWFDTPRQRATWFIDPPYNSKAGRCYPNHDIDYGLLSLWCQARLGQVIVCENEGADWLPFESFRTLKPGVNGSGSHEVIWTQVT